MLEVRLPRDLNVCELAITGLRHIDDCGCTVIRWLRLHCNVQAYARDKGAVLLLRSAALGLLSPLTGCLTYMYIQDPTILGIVPGYSSIPRSPLLFHLLAIARSFISTLHLSYTRSPSVPRFSCWLLYRIVWVQSAPLFLRPYSTPVTSLSWGVMIHVACGCPRWTLFKSLYAFKVPVSLILPCSSLWLRAQGHVRLLRQPS